MKLSNSYVDTMATQKLNRWVNKWSRQICAQKIIPGRGVNGEGGGSNDWLLNQEPNILPKLIFIKTTRVRFS